MGPLLRASASRRALAGSALVFLVASSIRARRSLSSGGPAHSFVAAGVVVVLLGLIQAVFVISLLRLPRHPRRPQREEVVEPTQQTLWERAGRLLVVAAALAVPALAIWGLVRLRGRSDAPLSNVTTPHHHHLVPGSGADASAATGSVWPLLGLAVAMLVVLLAMSVAAGRHLRRSPGAAAVAPRVELPVNASHVDVEIDPRQSVIAAYRSFEQEAAARGIAIDPPRTAGEISSHTVSSHLIDPGPVAALTDLFRRARYSTEVVSVADRTLVRDLLAQVQRQMRQAP